MINDVDGDDNIGSSEVCTRILVVILILEEVMEAAVGDLKLYTQ